MIQYTPDLPLVFIHVPKTAGVSVRQIFMDWFGEGFIRHYPNEKEGRLPDRAPRFETHSAGAPVCVYGHFNRLRGFGVEDNYPDARQFVTVLRDPFDMAISGYYYTRNVGADWKDQSRIPQDDLVCHLETAAPNMLNHFPRPVTAQNYRDIIDEFFIGIGFVEDLLPSLTRIADQLGRRFDPEVLERRNVTARDDQATAVEPLRAAYRACHPLEFEVYDYARTRFGPAIAERQV